jgi:putative spermidine/putrescine transport system substrate-binding protein
MPRTVSNAKGASGEGRRRSRRRLIAFALLASFAAGGAVAELVGQPPLTVVSFGGALTRSQMRAVIRPYREESGAWVQMLDHDGGLEEIAAQVHSENVHWDVVNLDLPDALRGCRQGLLERIDVAALPAGPDGTPARDDFYPAALSDCGIGHNVYATVVAYDLDAFDEPPTQIADFFDTRRFPGLRGLRRDPLVALEWGLLGDGVGRDELYATLKTEKGLRRAFRSLDRIRDDLIFWGAGEEGPGLIERGLVSMGSAWNGRVHAAKQRGARIGILWDGQVWNLDVWSVPRGTDRLGQALRFIHFATRSRVLARQSGEIPYGPARRSAVGLIPQEIQQHLPTAPARQGQAIRIDYEWWAEQRGELQARFEAWLARRPIYDFRNPDRN